MNRREMLKAAAVIPLVPATIWAADDKLARDTMPDWSGVVTDRRYMEFLESVKTILERFLGMSVRLERTNNSAGFLVGDVYIFGITCMVGGESEFDYMLRKWTDGSFRERLVRLLEIRWVDFMWSTHDAIVDRLKLMHSFDPGYRPEDH